MSVYDIHCIFEVCEHIRHVYDNVSRMYIYKIAIHHIHGGIRRAYISYTYAGKGSILTDANTPQKGLADETARSSDPRHQRLAQRHRQTTLLHYDFKNCVSKIFEMRPIWIRTCFSAFATRPPSPPSSPPTTPPFKGAARP